MNKNECDNKVCYCCQRPRMAGVKIEKTKVAYDVARCAKEVYQSIVIKPELLISLTDYLIEIGLARQYCHCIAELFERCKEVGYTDFSSIVRDCAKIISDWDLEMMKYMIEMKPGMEAL